MGRIALVPMLLYHAITLELRLDYDRWMCASSQELRALCRKYEPTPLGESDAFELCWMWELKCELGRP